MAGDGRVDDYSIATPGAKNGGEWEIERTLYLPRWGFLTFWDIFAPLATKDETRITYKNYKMKINFRTRKMCVVKFSNFIRDAIFYDTHFFVS